MKEENSRNIPTSLSEGKNDETVRSNNNEKNGNEKFQHTKLNNNRKIVEQPLESVLDNNLVTTISEKHLEEKKIELERFLDNISCKLF